MDDGCLEDRIGCFMGSIDECAGTFLTDLLADLLGGPHAYLLPCEAVFEHLLKKTSIEVERRKDEGERKQVVQFPLWPRAEF